MALLRFKTIIIGLIAGCVSSVSFSETRVEEILNKLRSAKDPCETEEIIKSYFRSNSAELTFFAKQVTIQQLASLPFISMTTVLRNSQLPLEGLKEFQLKASFRELSNTSQIQILRAVATAQLNQAQNVLQNGPQPDPESSLAYLRIGFTLEDMNKFGVVVDRHLANTIAVTVRTIWSWALRPQPKLSLDFHTEAITALRTFIIFVKKTNVIDAESKHQLESVIANTHQAARVFGAEAKFGNKPEISALAEEVCQLCKHYADSRANLRQLETLQHALKGFRINFEASSRKDVPCAQFYLEQRLLVLKLEARDLAELGLDYPTRRAALLKGKLKQILRNRIWVAQPAESMSLYILRSLTERVTDDLSRGSIELWNDFLPGGSIIAAISADEFSNLNKRSYGHLLDSLRLRRHHRGTDELIDQVFDPCRTILIASDRRLRRR